MVDVIIIELIINHTIMEYISCTFGNGIGIWIPDNILPKYNPKNVIGPNASSALAAVRENLNILKLGIT